MSMGSRAIPGGARWAPPRDAARWLSLAAAPTFAIMALATGIFASAPPDGFCQAAGHAAPLNGMAVMYALMSAFHCAPWLSKIAHRRA